MNLDKLYWRQDGLFDSSFIKKVKELAGQQKLKDLQLQDKNRELLTRDSKGCFINSTWLQTQLAPVINDTNKTLGWNFKLSKFEDLQYTSYDKSQHYSWHTDTHAKPYADGMVRKISFSLILNDEFEGGDFAICEPHPEHTKSIIHRFEKTKPGTIIVFYSGLWHKVYPVKSGQRQSLVGWTLGSKFQ
tara:strand:- start:104 stop:667 length:564 start_codon:yes stop_codon:yes gene_type:complete